jgi:hypothetical protein
MKTKLGKQEMQMLAYLQMRQRRTVKTGELTGPLQLSRDQERELFRRMARGGLIVRVRPGFYLAPAQLPLGGSWSPDENLALNILMDDRLGQTPSTVTDSTIRFPTGFMLTTTGSPASGLSERLP